MKKVAKVYDDYIKTQEQENQPEANGFTTEKCEYTKLSKVLTCNGLNETKINQSA